MAKMHLHDEQFDGYLHATCGAGDWIADAKVLHPRVVCDDDFERLSYTNRCRNCARLYWPHGEPIAKE